MSYRKWIAVSLLLFVAGIAAGLLMPSIGSSLFSDDITYLTELAKLYQPFRLETAVFLFVKNSLSLLLSFILSPLLCLVPVISLVTNGWLLAFVSTIAVREKSILFIIMGLLPHGIFELTAFILGEAAALSFGTTVIFSIFDRNKRAELPSNFKKNIIRLGITLALLLPAAIIETYVTPLLIR